VLRHHLNVEALSLTHTTSVTMSGSKAGFPGGITPQMVIVLGTAGAHIVGMSRRYGIHQRRQVRLGVGLPLFAQVRGHGAVENGAVQLPVAPVAEDHAQQRRAFFGGILPASKRQSPLGKGYTLDIGALKAVEPASLGKNASMMAVAAAQ
jgi:hypothetical protein